LILRSYRPSALPVYVQLEDSPQMNLSIALPQAHVVSVLRFLKTSPPCVIARLRCERQSVILYSIQD
jgi:hypothetical protein